METPQESVAVPFPSYRQRKKKPDELSISKITEIAKVRMFSQNGTVEIAFHSVRN